MNKNNDNNIILFVTHPESDQLVFDTLKNHYTKIRRCTELKEVCRLLVDNTPKIFLMTGDNLEKSLYNYYRSLDAVSQYDICEHRVVALVPRQSEKQAYDAYQAKIIDDYMVSRPVYEMHRIILICEHLLIELGVEPDSKPLNLSHYIQKSDKFAEAFKISLQKGMERKQELKHAFEISLIEVDNALEQATQKIQNNQNIDLDIKRLKETLSLIRSDEIRPELLKLQTKAISLLAQTIELKNNKPEQAKNQHTPSENTSNRSNEQSLINQTGTDNKSETQQPEKEPQYEFNRLYQQDVDPDELIQQANKIPCILLVEDDEISMQLTKMLLENYKVHLETVTNGRQAFANLTSKKYDLVLMDVNLPDTNGIYIVDQASSSNSINKDTPIIMLSGNKNKTTVAKALERGAKGYIVKPLHKSSVDKLFTRFLQKT